MFVIAIMNQNDTTPLLQGYRWMVIGVSLLITKGFGFNIENREPFDKE